MYKLLIFYFDKTLAETLPFFLSQVNALADKYKFRHLQEYDLDLLRSKDAKQIMRHAGVEKDDSQGRKIITVSVDEKSGEILIYACLEMYII